MTYLVFVWLFSWEYICIYSLPIILRLFVRRTKKDRGLRQYIFVLVLFDTSSFQWSIAVFLSSLNILSKWFMAIVYNSNCHLLLWSSCKSKRADAQAYVNKSFYQLFFYTYIYRDSLIILFVNFPYAVCMFTLFSHHRYLISTTCCFMSNFSDIQTTITFHLFWWYLFTL
jgi:hypothetical protein